MKKDQQNYKFQKKEKLSIRQKQTNDLYVFTKGFHKKFSKKIRIYKKFVRMIFNLDTQIYYCYLVAVL